jgi:glycosyltransferase involved in cell wall biosynthesis
MHFMSSGIAAVEPPTANASAARPLRILQVISSVAALDGGSSTAMWSILEALKRRGVDTDLVTTNEDGSYRVAADVPLGGFIQQPGYRIQYFPSAGNRYATSWPLAQWLLTHVRDYDVVHIHGIFRFTPVAAAYAALLRGVPYVLTLHNALGSWGLLNRRPLLKKLSISVIEGRMIRGARRVHLCSANELAQVSRIIEIGNRAAVFPLGLELNGSDDSQTVAMDRVASKTRTILFMSRIHEIKGLDTLIRAFAAIHRRYPDTELAVAGTGDGCLTESLQALAVRLQVDGRIRWVGFVRGAAKQALLHSASVFVLPSQSENFGYAVVEALSAGLPVITTVHVPTGEFVKLANAGVVYDGSSAGLEQSLMRMLDLPDRQLREMGRSGAHAVRNRLSLDAFGESLESCYRESFSA